MVCRAYEFNGNACFKGRQGYLYFGGINGFNAFNPREIKVSTYLPPVVITNFWFPISRFAPATPSSPTGAPSSSAQLPRQSFSSLTGSTG